MNFANFKQLNTFLSSDIQSLLYINDLKDTESFIDNNFILNWESIEKLVTEDEKKECKVIKFKLVVFIINFFVFIYIVDKISGFSFEYCKKITERFKNVWKSAEKWFNSQNILNFDEFEKNCLWIGAERLAIVKDVLIERDETTKNLEDLLLLTSTLEYALGNVSSIYFRRPKDSFNVFFHSIFLDLVHHIIN